MPNPRSTYAGIATGAILLAGVVGFGVGLPEVVGDGSAETPALPDQIAGYTALSQVTAEDAGVTSDEDKAALEEFLASAEKQDEEAAEALGEEYGDASVRAYVDAAGMANAAQTGGTGQFSVTVLPGEETGPVFSGGPYQADTYRLQTIDGHRCSVAWQSSTPGAEPTDLDYQVECRAAEGGLVYDVYSIGIAPEKAADILTELIETT
ncbi:hypothetical protein [Nocardioides sambongensis]|uniref:hypothetical protein n=1 Tax=Nocardioides sambongensis TaxID=2589074 RepID=UPI00112C85E5|nr:hypothetical protein [Nocardioides sambongensis]